MRRYTITLGAPSTSGGKVISASGDAVIAGMPIALEGDLVTCPVCKSAGKILCVGPRIPETWNGRNVALENDLCMCRCDSAPRLMPSQNVRCQVIKDSGRALSNPVAQDSARVAGAHAFNDRFALIDERDGTALARREYAVVRANGNLEFGTSDGMGQTHLLSRTTEAEWVEIYVQGGTRAPSLISPSGAVLHHRARVRTTPVGDASVKVLRLLASGPARRTTRERDMALP